MCSSSRSHASSASVSPAPASQISSDRHDARSARTPCCAGGGRPGTPGRQPLPGGLSTAFIPIGLAGGPAMSDLLLDDSKLACS